MKTFAVLFFACSLLMGSENWELIEEQNGYKYLANTEMQLITVENDKVVIIKSKVVAPRGGVSLTNHYWRIRNGDWEAAMKTNDLFRANGTLRSHKEINDSKLSWVAATKPKDKTWIALLDKAAAMLEATK